jgi:hypothetical protein
VFLVWVLPRFHWNKRHNQRMGERCTKPGGANVLVSRSSRGYECLRTASFPQQRQVGSPTPSRARGSRGLSLHQLWLLNREFDSTGIVEEPWCVIQNGGSKHVKGSRRDSPQTRRLLRRFGRGKESDPFHSSKGCRFGLACLAPLSGISRLTSGFS